jgi:hypothetical protein
MDTTQETNTIIIDTIVKPQLNMLQSDSQLPTKSLHTPIIDRNNKEIPYTAKASHTLMNPIVIATSFTPSYIRFV